MSENTLGTNKSTRVVSHTVLTIVCDVGMYNSYDNTLRKPDTHACDLKSKTLIQK